MYQWMDKWLDGQIDKIIKSYYTNYLIGKLTFPVSKLLPLRLRCVILSSVPSSSPCTEPESKGGHLIPSMMLRWEHIIIIYEKKQI